MPRKGGAPFTFDMATSAVALFGVLTAKAKGAPLAEGVAYGVHAGERDDGQATALALLDGGAIATFGGHKGAGLALCVELLAGALSGGAVVGQEVKKEAKNWGHLFLCVKPDALVDDSTRRPPPSVKLSRTRERVPGDRSAASRGSRQSRTRAADPNARTAQGVDRRVPRTSRRARRVKGHAATASRRGGGPGLVPPFRQYATCGRTVTV